MDSNDAEWARGHFDLGLLEHTVHSTVYPNAPAGYEFPGDSGFATNKCPANTKLDDFAPRFGLAWDPHGPRQNEHPSLLGHVL